MEKIIRKGKSYFHTYMDLRLSFILINALTTTSTGRYAAGGDMETDHTSTYTYIGTYIQQSWGQNEADIVKRYV